MLLIYVCHKAYCSFGELQSVCEMRWGRKETNVFDQAEIFVAATGTVDALNINIGADTTHSINNSSKYVVQALYIVREI